jgi:hypothetical protein
MLSQSVQLENNTNQITNVKRVEGRIKYGSGTYSYDHMAEIFNYLPMEKYK